MKKQADSKINADGWMMSYADMATILLAMFIVLSTLGKDQTGFNLNKALESVQKHHSMMGLPGLTNNSKLPFSLNNPGAKYLTEQSEIDSAEPAKLPDKISDLEEHQWQLYLEELNRLYAVQAMPKLVGQAAVDFFDPLPSKAPYWKGKPREVAGQIVPLLSQKHYQVFIVAWATMPKDSAWQRAVAQAQLLADELAQTVALDPDARARLVAVGQPWPHPKMQRPVFSVIVAKLEK